MVVVTTDQLFDAYNYGERSPFAIRDFLNQSHFRDPGKLQGVLLVGDASLDPRNYLGFGDFDFTDLFDLASGRPGAPSGQ